MCSAQHKTFNSLSNKMACHNSREEMEAEQSLQTAALLSLAGVSCLLSRQWSSTVDSCTDTMCSFIKSMLLQIAVLLHVLCFIMFTASRIVVEWC